jgi:hypothetical protein
LSTTCSSGPGNMTCNKIKTNFPFLILVAYLIFYCDCNNFVSSYKPESKLNWQATQINKVIVVMLFLIP